MNKARFPTVVNKDRVQTTVCIGTVMENRTTEACIRRMRPGIEHIFVNTKKEAHEIRQELKEAVAGKTGVLAISDIGDTRPHYTFEMLAGDLKGYNPDAAFALLTSKQECTGLHATMQEFVQARGFDAAILGKVDYVLQYGGNEEVFRLALQLHEDHMNFRQDKERAIIVIEDMPNYYTNYMLSLYQINEGRARVLLARDFESASRLVEGTGGKLAGAIVDMRFPKEGELSESAWKEAVRLMRENDPKAPIILQSADSALVAAAENQGGFFTLFKQDPEIFVKLRGIMSDYFGFGQFVFRSISGNELARADDLEGVKRFVRGAAPGSEQAESVFFHAKHNSFSNWLWLHGHKREAERLKAYNSATFEEAQKNILEAFESIR